MNGGENMVVYECMHCEYKFDSEKGDAQYNIAPGTTIDKMPDDWACPECAALGKDAFVAIDE